MAQVQSSPNLTNQGKTIIISIYNNQQTCTQSKDNHHQASRILYSIVVLSPTISPTRRSRQQTGKIDYRVHRLNTKSMQALWTLNTLKHMQQTRPMR